MRWLGPFPPALLIMLLFSPGRSYGPATSHSPTKALTGWGPPTPNGWLQQFHPYFSDRCSSTLFCSPSFMSSVGHNRAEYPRVPHRPAPAEQEPIFTPCSTRLSSALGHARDGAAFCWYAYLYQADAGQLLAHVGLSQDWLYTTPMLAIIIATCGGALLFPCSCTRRRSPTCHRPARGGPGRRGQPAVDAAADHHPLLRRSIVTNLMLITCRRWPAHLIFVLTAGGRGGEPDDAPVHLPAALQLYDISYGRPCALSCCLSRPVLRRVHQAHQGGGSVMSGASPSANHGWPRRPRPPGPPGPLPDHLARATMAKLSAYGVSSSSASFHHTAALARPGAFEPEAAWAPVPRWCCRSATLARSSTGAARSCPS